MHKTADRACRTFLSNQHPNGGTSCAIHKADLRLDNLVGISQRTPTTLSFWVMASRPRTLTISATPVMVGTALAWAAQGRVHWLAVLAALVGSMFIQIGTNIHNDAADFERGGDGPDRIGPARVTASGLLSATTVKRGAYICFAIAALMGAYLVSAAVGQSCFSACCPSQQAGATPADRFRLPTPRLGNCFA